MGMIQVTLNQKLKYLRSLEKIPQSMLAEILQIDRSTYSYYESGKTTPNVYMLYAIARIYDLPMEFFVDDSWEMDGAEEFMKSNARIYGHYRSENALYMQKHLDYYKRLMRRMHKNRK